ncbi:glycosyltransferase family 4 protein [Archangium gephyra]|uniref:glycosyltransferase family 4 protein n=1 Tax=Archangium gephyra TaxID=48 RepID=UPI0035D42574
MKLALVTHNVIRSDGQGRVNYQLARHALAKGHEVLLLADQVEPELLERGARWLRLHPRVQKPHLLKVAEFTQRASALVRRVRGEADILHANGYVLDEPHHLNTSHFVHAAWLRSSVRASEITGRLRSTYQWLYTAANARWEQRAYRQARLVAAVSEAVREDLLATGLSPEHVVTVPNGVDLEEFHPGREPRAAWGLPEDKPLALFVGGIRTGRKNLDTVLAALREVPGLHLAVVGDVRGSPFPALAERLGVANRVSFLGFRDDVARLLRASDLFVFPSRYETFALVVLEALASGVPVVTARSVGAASLVTPKCGIVLPDAEDAAALARAMRSLVENASLRERMGLEAREVAREHGWAEMAAAYFRLYERLAASPLR